MDRVKEYIENINIKNAVVGGFDKESVYVSLKELVAIFEEELGKSQKECLDLKKKLQTLNQDVTVQQNTNSEIFNEISRLKKYEIAYQDAQKQLHQLEKERYNQSLLNKKIKEESQHKLEQLQLKYNELLNKTKNNNELLSLNYVKDNFNQTIEQLSTRFVQQNENILLENKQLKEENEKLKTLVDQYQLSYEEKKHFVDEINQLYNSLDSLKSRYIKDNE